MAEDNFHTLDIENLRLHYNKTPVSYTHLDVYKRQRLHILWAFRPQTEGFRPEGREVFIMIIYVDASVIQTGNGTKENP